MTLHAARPDRSPRGLRGPQRWLLAAAMAVAPCTAAWATHEYVVPLPVQPAPVVVKVQAHPDLPKLAVPGPKSDMVLGFDNSVGLGLLFGALGVAVAAANQAKAGDASAAGLPSIALVEPARSLIGAWSASPASLGRFIAEGPGAATSPVLEIVPLAILSFTDRERRSAQAFVELRAKLVDGQQRVLWRTRYVASTGGVRPMSGDTGWTAQQGAALTTAMDASLRAGLGFLLQDLSSPAARTGGAPFNADVYVPRQDKPWKLEGQVIAQDAGGYVLIASHAYDNHLTGGLFVLERSRLGPLPGLPALQGAQTAGAPIPSSPVAAASGGAVTPPARAEVPGPVRAITAAEVEGRTWRYAHPRDPGRFGDVRLAFRDGRVEASNARSKAQGHYELRKGKLCITYERAGWPDACLSLVEGPDGAPMLWASTLSRALPLFIE